MGIDLVEDVHSLRRRPVDAVVVVNQRFAEGFWPGESAAGKTVTTAGEDREVIGVVETGKYASLGEDPTEFM